jgi:hypothetical protein
MNAFYLHNDIKGVQHSISYLEDKSEFYDISTESEEIGNMTTGSLTTDVRTENVDDIGGDEMTFQTFGKNNNTKVGSKEVNDMGDFLSRMLQVYSDVIPLGAHYDLNLNIWDLFTSHPTVRSKLRNYAFLRGNLHCRISISGTPFQYGKFMFSYQPFVDNNLSLTNLLNMYAIDPSYRPLIVNYLSQSEGSIVMDIRENVPAEMLIPYISPKPMFRLYNVQTTAINTSFNDIVNVGDLFMYSINIPQSSSTGSTDPFIQVYCWMTEVELGTNTATQLVINTESLESKMGPVQTIASRIYDTSLQFLNVPILRPYATATSLAAGALSSIAGLFGWSYPIQSNPNTNVRTIPYSNTAQCGGTSVANKISVDPKQETSIGGDVVSIEADHMSISNIASRRTYLTTTTWLPEYTYDSILYTTRVTPCLSTGYNAVSNLVTLQPTAMAFTAFPFNYWRGDIKFRIEVVASQFHRGKLAIYFEPNVNQYTLITTTNELNKQYITLMDIQETQTIDFVVKWASHREWLKVQTPYQSQLNDMESVAYLTNFAEDYCNGFIYITPFTQLQSPDGSGVDINIYVSSDDIHYNGPCNKNFPIQRRIITGEDAPIIDMSTESEDVSTTSINTASVTTKTLNASTASCDGISENYFGEEIVNFRTLLKRYQSNFFFIHNVAVVANERIRYYFPIFPIQRVPFDTAATTYSPTLFSYLQYAYLGYKGSIRHMFFHNRSVNDNALAAYPQTIALGEPATTNIALSASNGTGVAETQMNNLGTIVNIRAYNPSYEVEFPFYSNNLWCFACNNTNDDTLATVGMEKEWFRNANLLTDPQNAGNANNLQSKVAVGEDFTFLRFLGAPFTTTVLYNG